MTYSYGRQLGSGSFGSVFKATKDGKDYAIKVIDDVDQYAIEEVRILQSVDHENIIKYIDSYIKNHKLHIVMEYANNGSLARYESAVLQERNIWQLFSQMASALNYLHGRNILHRDFKPDNILCVEKSNIISLKVADFGLAKLLTSNAQGNHYAGTYAGTHIYMAPEVLKRETYTFSADMWSLGAVISFLCKDAVKNWSGGKSAVPNTFSSDLREIVANLLCQDRKQRPYITEVYSITRSK